MDSSVIRAKPFPLKKSLLYFTKYFSQNCFLCFRSTLFQEIRRRHRYLAHLPLTCEFSICELALQPPVLSKETLDSFAGLG